MLTDLKVAVEDIERSSQDFREKWLTVGLLLLRLRETYPADRDLGVAIAEYEIDLTRQHRGAAMWLAGLTDLEREEAYNRWPDAMHPVTLRNTAHAAGWDTTTTRPVSTQWTPATNIEVTTESQQNALSEPESVVDPISKSRAGEHGGSFKPYPRSKLVKFGVDAEWLLTIFKDDGRNQITAMVPAHNKFLRFVIDKLKDGVIHPKVSASHVMHAGTLINGLHKSITREVVFSNKGKTNAKAMHLFMDHFELFLEAERLGWDYNALRQAINGKPPRAKTGIPESWTAPAPAAQPSGPLPDLVVMNNGMELHPEPIYVCGVCLYPSEARPGLSYVDAYLEAHDCRELIWEFSGNAKEIGMSISHRGLRFGRQYPQRGAFISVVGSCIQSRGETMHKSEWFKLEPFRQTTVA
jgi:hypothetical protein